MQSEDYLNRLRALTNQQNVPLKVIPAQQPAQIPQQYAPTFNKPSLPVQQVKPVQLNVNVTPNANPSYPSLGARISDIFNANSPQDIAKRLAANQPATYEAQKISQGERPLSNLFTQAFAPVIRPINTVSSFVQQLPSTAKIITGLATGNRPAAERAAQQLAQIQERTLAPKSGLFGVGTVVPSNQALGKMKFGDVAKTAVGAGAELASFAVGGGELPTLAKIAGKEGLKQLGTFVAKEAVAGALAGGGGTISRKPSATGKEIATGALTGAAIGAPLALTAGLVTSGISNALSRPAGKALVAKLTETTDQVIIKDTIRELLPNATNEELNNLSSRIAKSTSTTEIDNILRTAAENVPTTAVSGTAAEAATLPTTPVVQQLTDTLAKTTDVAAIKDTVRSLLPQLNDAGQTQFAEQIAKANTPEAVTNILDRAEAASKAVTQGIEQVTPQAPSPIQRQAEAAAKLVEQPPIREVAPKPVTETPTIKQPSGVSGTAEIKDLQKQITRLQSVSDINTTVYRGENEVNISKANPDRPVYYAETPDYASTYGTVVSKPITGKVLTVEGIHGYEQITQQLRKVIASYLPVEEWKKLSAIERANIESWVNHTLYGERLSTQFNKPMPEVVKKAFNDLGIDYIKIPGDQFKGTVGNIGHQTEIIEIPKPTVIDTTQTIGITTPKPLVESPVVTTPSGITQTVSTNIVPGSIETLPERLATLAEQQKQKYAPTTFIQKIKEIWNPRTTALEIDKAYAKQIENVKFGDLLAINRLEYYISQASQSAQMAEAYLKNSEIAKVIQKYRPNTPEGNAFNTYRIFKRDLEQIADGRPAIVRSVTEADKVAFIQQFEKTFPTAEKDLRSMVKDIYALQDITATGKDSFIDPKQLELARTKKDGSTYQFWTPVERAMPDNLERPMINSRNIGTLGQQRVLQDFTSSNIPIDPTYNSITDYVGTIYKQLGQSRVVKKFAERVKQGVVEGAQFVQTPEDYIKMQQLKATYNELKDVSLSLKNEIRKTISQTKVAGEQVKTEIAKMKVADVRASLNLKAASKAAQDKIKVAVSRGKELIAQSLDPTAVDAKAALNDLTDQELIDLLDYMTQGELFYTPPAGRAKFNAVQSAKEKVARASEITKSQQAALDRISKKGNTFQNLVDNVSNLKMDLQVIDNNRRGIRQELIDLRTDPTTGLQTIIGRDVNGVPFRIEVTPKYARLLQGIGNEQLNTALQVVSNIQKPFKTAFTGAINPAFQIAQATWNSILTPLLSKDSIRVYAPDAIQSAFKSFNANDAFQKLLRENGAAGFTGEYTKLVTDTTAEALAAEANKLSKLKWYGNPKRGWDKLSEYGGKFDNAARTSAAEAAYQRVLQQTGNKEAALAEAIFARTQVLPDFGNVSSAVRQLDALIPYTAPLQTGLRTFFRAITDNPAQMAGKLGALGSIMGILSAYNIANDQGEAFYKDMIDSNKGYILDNNLIIVLPNAKKNEKSGEWSGIIKIGLPNEVRPINKAIRSTIYSGQPGVPLRQYATSLFDFFTGNIKDNSNPAINLATAIKTGKDPRTGREIFDQTMDNNQKRDAILKYTAQSFGVPGKIAVSDKPLNDFVMSFVDRVYGAKGSTEASRYYINQDTAIGKVKPNRIELDAYYSAVAPPSKDLTGNVIKDKTYYDSAKKALTYLSLPKTFEISKEIDRLARQQGKPGDPIFDLPADKLKVILNMQANFSPGNYEDQATLKLNPWITDFNKSRSEYFNKVISDEKKKASGVDPMGITIPQATPELSSKLNKLKTLTNAEKSQFYSENPDVTEFFAAQDNYERVKRGFLGLPQFDSYPTPISQTQNFIDEFNKLPKGTKSAWIKSNPDKWTAITQQWTQQDIYRLQKEGALGVYEGIDFTAQGLKSIQDIAKAIGGTGFGGFGYSQTSPEYKAALAALAQVKPLEALKVTSAAPRQIKLKRVSVPVSRRTARIRLR